MPDVDDYEMYLSAVHEELIRLEVLAQVKREGFTFEIGSPHDLEVRELQGVLQPILSDMWANLRFVRLTKL